VIALPTLLQTLVGKQSATCGPVMSVVSLGTAIEATIVPADGGRS